MFNKDFLRIEFGLLTWIGYTLIAIAIYGTISFGFTLILQIILISGICLNLIDVIKHYWKNYRRYRK
jgi:hypothetical protein